MTGSRVVVVFVGWLVGWLVGCCFLGGVGAGGGVFLLLLLFCGCFVAVVAVVFWEGGCCFVFAFACCFFPCRCVCDLFGAFTSNAFVGGVWMGGGGRGVNVGDVVF